MAVAGIRDLFAQNLAELKQIEKLSLANSSLTDAGVKNLHGQANLYNERPTWLALAHKKLDVSTARPGASLAATAAVGLDALNGPDANLADNSCRSIDRVL